MLTQLLSFNDAFIQILNYTFKNIPLITVPKIIITTKSIANNRVMLLQLNYFIFYTKT